MPTQVQFRRGTASQNNNFTGAVGELSVNTDNNSIRVHDGVTSGGYESAKNNLSNAINVGILTASGFSGNITGTAATITNIAGTLSGNATSATTAGYATTSGIATVAQGLTGTPNITVSSITSGNINSSGVVTATSFIGNGSGLTGVASTDNIRTSTSATFLNNVSVSGVTTLSSTVNIGGNLTITGNLQVDGTTTTINSTTLTIDDKLIVVASGAANAAAADGSGISVDGANATLTYSSSGDKWVSNKDFESANFNATSDANFKENVQIIENSLDKIHKIDGVEFTWKETKKGSLGVIAQNVESVFPQLVNTSDSGKSVNYNGLIGVLIEAVKELSAEVSYLHAKIDELQK